MPLTLSRISREHELFINSFRFDDRKDVSFVIKLMKKSFRINYND